MVKRDMEERTWSTMPSTLTHWSRCLNLATSSTLTVSGSGSVPAPSTLTFAALIRTRFLSMKISATTTPSISTSMPNSGAAAPSPTITETHASPSWSENSSPLAETSVTTPRSLARVVPAAASPVAGVSASLTRVSSARSVCPQRGCADQAASRRKSAGVKLRKPGKSGLAWRPA